MAALTDLRTQRLLVVHGSSPAGCCSPSIINDKREGEHLVTYLHQPPSAERTTVEGRGRSACACVCVCVTMNSRQDTFRVEFLIQKTNITRLTLTVDQYRRLSVK